MTNKDRPNAAVRDALAKNDMFVWELAELKGCSESTMIRHLRTELPKEEQKELINLIKHNS